MSGLEDLRNDVMHPSNSLINAYDGVKRLSERLEKIQKVTRRFESVLGVKRLYLEVYGSLLNSEQRKGYGDFKEVGKVKRIGWKLSFDRFSNTWKGAVLNFVQTKDDNDIFYTMVFEVDEKVFDCILEREMGRYADKWKLDKPIPDMVYRPVEMNSPFGKTKMFVIPDEGRKLTPTTKSATYVEIVRLGIEESFEDKMKETNLKALDIAINESNQRVSCQKTTYNSRLLKFR